MKKCSLKYLYQLIALILIVFISILMFVSQTVLMFVIQLIVISTCIGLILFLLFLLSAFPLQIIFNYILSNDLPEDEFKFYEYDKNFKFKQLEMQLLLLLNPTIEQSYYVKINEFFNKHKVWKFLNKFYKFQEFY